MSPTFGLLPLLHLLLLLLLLLLQPVEVHSESPKPESQLGKEFLVAFPEIIASYHLTRPRLRIQATGLFSNTEVTTDSIFDNKTSVQTIGKTEDFTFHEDIELGKEEISNKTVRITSTENITVFATSQKNNSVQTVLIVPTDTLGTRYSIPAVPSIAGTTKPSSAVTMLVTERSPFRIIIINAGDQNKVTVKGNEDKVISLSPYEVAQVWLHQDENMQAVEAEAPVAVFFGHPCALRKKCTCGQLYTMVPPAEEDTTDFVIPPFLVGADSNETVVLVSDGSGGSSSKPYDKDSPVVKHASTAILYTPGMLLPLIPESDFASCYIVSAIPDITSYVVIMVEADETDGVHVGTKQVDKNWVDVKDTVYKETRFELSQGRSVVWHSYSKMAVYFIGDDEVQFGHPAPIISTTPDHRGCALVPDSLHVGASTKGWPESLKYCLDGKLEFASFYDENYLKQIHNQLAQRGTEDLTEVWIGMRRSSLTGEWYSANSLPVNVTNWDEDEPGTVEEGQCAMMSVKNEDFTWRDEECCKKAKPLCISPGTFITG